VCSTQRNAQCNAITQIIMKKLLSLLSS